CGRAPGSANFAGALFAVFAGLTLTRASDGRPSGAARSSRAVAPYLGRRAESSPRRLAAALERRAASDYPVRLSGGGGDRTRILPIQSRGLYLRLSYAPTQPHKRVAVR